jgi:hypothetical protein|nr:MAG TPA: hypothetical protein [Caudoviricetes sp.]
MEQISLEDKVSNTLKWLANQIACIQVYKKWNEQQIKVSDVLKAITDYKPIFGHRTTIKNQTIWMAFMK